MTGASNGQMLHEKIGLVFPLLSTTARSLLSRPDVADVYPEYLFTLHGMIRATVPLMETARDRAAALAGTDRVAGRLAGYLEDHIPEELHHYEWLLDDLEVLGRSREQILRRPPSGTVAALVGSQYYWILHHHPVALLGYIAVMEGYPPSVAVVEDLIVRTGFPRTAFRTLLEHAELDVGHGAELTDFVDSLSLDSDQASVVGTSALQTVILSAQALAEIR